MEKKYISLETFRRNGQGVRTPVWFAEANGILFVYSEAKAGKVKRIRANPRVRIAECDFWGKVQGNWVDGVGRIVSGDEEKLGHELLNRKYRWKAIFNWLSRLRGARHAIVAIRLSESTAR
jgi:hypothetical protein